MPQRFASQTIGNEIAEDTRMSSSINDGQDDIDGGVFGHDDASTFQCDQARRFGAENDRFVVTKA